MKILLNNCYGGIRFSDELCSVLKEKFGTDNPYQLRENQDAIEIIERWIGEGKDVSGDNSRLSIKEIPAGVKYIVDDENGYESIVLQDDIAWKTAF